MFWKNKNVQQIINLEERMTAKLEALEQGIASGSAQAADMSRNLEQLQRTVREQGMSVEDLLEEWSERKSAEDSLREQHCEHTENEQHLLGLFEAYQEQFRNMKRFAEGRDESWLAQIAMMERNLEHCRQLCGISLVGECGTEVDYDFHEVIEVMETEQPDQDRKIADVYRNGYLYKGKVRRKAQVAAYSFKKPDGGSTG